MYRLGVEMMLGLHRAGDNLQINPCIPKGWHDYEMEYRLGKKTMYHILVKNPQGMNCGASQIVMDGSPLTDANIPLIDDDQIRDCLTLR
jgi:cellobiose phosphorylase